MRRLHKEKTRIQSLENELKKARAEGNPFTPTQFISVPSSAAPSISITSIDTEDETLGTNIQLSTTPSHLTLTITTPTSSSVSISHGNGVSLTLGPERLEQRARDRKDSIDKLAVKTPTFIGTDASTTTPTAIQASTWTTAPAATPTIIAIDNPTNTAIYRLTHLNTIAIPAPSCSQYIQFNCDQHIPPSSPAYVRLSQGHYTADVPYLNPPTQANYGLVNSRRIEVFYVRGMFN